ncbi:hypothetical protein IV102_23450 [bacterium]|nr:hypothetical protein [bacterium]
MDPIYYQVNQTKLTEVTQKSSDNLRLQSNKEAKRKSQATEVDKSAMSTDTSSMSDDMLGNMDPDDYGGRGAKQFAQMWKEQLEEEEEEEKEEEDQEEEEQQSQDEQAPNKEEAEIEAVSDDPPPALPTPTSPRVDAPSSEVPERVAEVDPSPEPFQPEKATSAEKYAPQKVVTPPTGPPPSAAQKRSSLASLLDCSSGYLIAEEAAWDINAQDAEAEVAAEEVEEALPEEISILLERLVTGDSSRPAYRKLHQLLSRFGRRVLQVCLEAHAKVYLLPPGEPLLAHPRLAQCGFSDLEGAAYLPDQRLCLVEDACLSQAPHGFHPVFYYFAHLYDHALGGEGFASQKSAAVRASFQACLDGAHRFGDLMAAHSPAHYFAQAVESYLAENDCYQPLWTRQDLYDFDRSIYNYIEYLLR